MLVKKPANITISTLCKKLGINVQTVRYYESMGLIPEPERTEAGYRVYDEAYEEHIAFVKNSQRLGFSLEEIAELAQLKFQNKALGKDVKKLIGQKIQQIETEIEELQATKSYLEKLDRSCSGKMKSSCCPILQGLTQSH